MRAPTVYTVYFVFATPEYDIALAMGYVQTGVYCTPDGLNWVRLQLVEKGKDDE